MRTNVEIDDDLMAQARAVTGARTKRETIQFGLETLVRLGAQSEVRRLKGALSWEGDLEQMRRDR